MNEKNIFLNLKENEPKIKNIEHVKNNIILNSKSHKKKMYFEFSILIIMFIFSLLLLASSSFTITFNSVNEIYRETSFSLIIPTLLMSGFLALAGLFIYTIIQIILNPKEV